MTAFLVFSQPAVLRLFSPITQYVEPFITKQEAEGILLGGQSSDAAELEVKPPRISSQKAGCICLLALMETIIWVTYGTYSVVAFPNLHAEVVVYSFIMAFVWGYIVLRSFIWPISTVPFDLFVLLSFHLIFSTVDVTTTLYGRLANGIEIDNVLIFVLMVIKWFISMSILVIVLSTPLDTPSADVDSGRIPGKFAEDYTTLWGWISFSWMQPLMDQARVFLAFFCGLYFTSLTIQGLKRTLNEEDVPDMSVTSQSKPIFAQFSTLQSGSLLRRLFLANKHDLIVSLMYM